MRQPEKKVDLSRKAYPAVSSHLSAWTDAQGLVIEGQDIGPGVESVWGDSDYEYWLTVDQKHLDQVLTGLARKLNRRVRIPDRRTARDKLLLKLLKQSWARGLFHTDVDFREWLNATDVPSEFSSYV